MAPVESPTSPAPVLATMTALVLSAGVPLALTYGGMPEYLGGPTTAGLIVIIALAGLRYAWIVGSAERHPHEMVTWLFVYLFLGVAPFVQLLTGATPSTTPWVDVLSAPTAVGVSLVGVVALIVGSQLARSRQRRNQPNAAPRGVRESRVSALALGSLALAAFYVNSVGPASLFLSRAEFSAVRNSVWRDSAVSSLIVAAVNMSLLVTFVALMHERRQRLDSEQKPRTALTLLVAAVLLACVNPVSSPRYVFGTVILGMVAALGAYSTVRRFRVVALAALVGMVTVFPVLDTFRRSLSRSVVTESPTEALTTGDFDAFAQVINAVAYVSENGVDWGRQLLGVTLSWVPRALWPAKPKDTGTLLAEWMGYSFQNLSAPLWAEMYIAAGVVGVALGLGAFGFMVRLLDARAESSLRLSQIPTVLGCIVPFYLLIVLRGSLLQAMANLTVILVCAWFAQPASITERGGRSAATSVSGSAGLLRQ